jgi:hypothetical protein
LDLLQLNDKKHIQISGAVMFADALAENKFVRCGRLICAHVRVSHSGFLAAINRNKKNKYENLYIYTLVDQSELRKDLWIRDGRKAIHFLKLND